MVQGMAAWRRRRVLAGMVGASAALAAPAILRAAPSGAPVKVGGTLSLTGFLAQTAVIHKIASEMMVEEINKRNGLLGRPVEYVLLDDQSKPDVARSLYEKLITVDKVDLIQGPYATAAQCAHPIDHRFLQPARLFVGVPLSREWDNEPRL